MVEVPAITILFALRREALPFLRAFPVQEHVRAAPCRARLCGRTRPPVLVMETGVGRKRMELALDWVLGQPLLGGVPYLPKLVISAGFSGALREDLHVGDVIVATEVLGPDGTCHGASWPGDRTTAWPAIVRHGRLLTTDRMIVDPAEKRALAFRHDALAVDMESAIVGGRCSRLGIPFTCIRVISDDAHAPLSPELDHVIVNGRLSLRRLTGSLLRRPRLAAELWRLAGKTRLAAERLATELGALLRKASSGS